MNTVFLALIFAFNFLTRFWKFAKVPPLLHSSDYSLRLSSSIIGLLIPFLIFFVTAKFYKNKKLSLLTAFIFSLFPQTIIEGRVVSFPFVYDFSIFNVANLQKLITNFMDLISPDMLFFRNVTFFWGGIKEFGILYISMLPFFFFGIYYSLTGKKIITPVLILFIFILISSSKNFPETRLLFYSLPFLSLIISFGILKIFKFKNTLSRYFLLAFLIFAFFELMQFFHYYFIHYPADVGTNSQKITYPF